MELLRPGDVKGLDAVWNCSDPEFHADDGLRAPDVSMNHGFLLLFGGWITRGSEHAQLPGVLFEVTAIAGDFPLNAVRLHVTG